MKIYEKPLAPGENISSSSIQEGGISVFLWTRIYILLHAIVQSIVPTIPTPPSVDQSTRGQLQRYKCKESQTDDPFTYKKPSHIQKIRTPSLIALLRRSPGIWSEKSQR